MSELSKETLMLTDLAKIQKELQAVVKSSKNPFFKSSYADLNAHLSVIRPLCIKHGFVLEQSTTIINSSTGAVNAVMSRISHIETGLTKESVVVIPELDGDMQKIGGAITYARRYTLSALFGMMAEDDDGNLASGKTTKFEKTKPKSELF